MPKKKLTFNQKVDQRIAKAAETKRTETRVYNTELINTAPLNDSLYAIAGGSGRNNRVGESVYYRSFGGRLVVARGAGVAAGTIQRVRIIVYHPYQNDDLLTGNNTVSYVEPERYNVFLDKLIVLTEDNPVRVVKLGYKFWNKHKKGMKMHWTSAAAADISRGQLICNIVSDQAAGATNPSVDGRINAFFKDF